MEQYTDALKMLDLMDHPAFCVKGGIIIKTNSAAASHMLEAGIEIEPLLLTGVKEYHQLKGGCLYLSLCIGGESVGASVSHIGEYDVFCIEQEADSRELAAMALAARELREPLASVMLTAERLFPVVARTDDPAAREQVARINRGLFQMLRAIGNMSDAGRYAAGSGSRQEVRDICSVLAECFERAAALAEKAGVPLDYEGLPGSVYCLADAEKLERAVYNILSNAIKFAPGKPIHAKLTRRGDLLCLSVSDSGTGIDERLRGSMFTRYMRTAQIEDGRFGIGLGMVLIRATAAQHGGSVLIDHPDGMGTRITMTIAIRQSACDQVQCPALRVDYAGERDHGLIELSDVLPVSSFDWENLR